MLDLDPIRKRDDQLPACACGSRAAGLVWIPDEQRLQCGDCIHKVYAEVVRLRAERKDALVNQGGADFGPCPDCGSRDWSCQASEALIRCGACGEYRTDLLAADNAR